MAQCEQCNKKLREFSNKLNSENQQVEKTMLKCENPLRYLELKAIYEANRSTIRKLDEELQIFN